jgi:hypothetical protein
MTRFCLACLLALVLGAAPAHAQSEPIALHDGLGGQDRVGRLSWRGGIALRFEDENFGGVSAMEIEPGGRTVTMLTDRGHAAEVFLDYDAGGKLSGAKLVKIRPVLGAASRNIGDERNSDIEAIARIADGGWIVAFERNHRVLQYPRSFEPLRAAPAQHPAGNPAGPRQQRHRGGERDRGPESPADRGGLAHRPWLHLCLAGQRGGVDADGLQPVPALQAGRGRIAARR